MSLLHFCVKAVTILVYKECCYFGKEVIALLKHIYKGLFLIIIFAGALFFFGRMLETDISDAGTETTWREETFPTMQIITQGKTINPLYGYAAPMEPDIVRESMTPLAADRTITLVLDEAKTYFTRLQYQILDKESGEVYDTQTINALAEEQGQVEIAFNYNFKTSTEYILDILGITNTGREIHYYTRLKYYLNESFLAKKLDFVREFHKNTFKSNKEREIGRYLEPSVKNRNTTLASVDITSSVELVTWAGMSPEIISDEYITVKEYNMETACVQYNYFVRARASSGREIYQIKEFYRVRYASGQSYLLNFRRTMEAQFDPAQASRQTSQLKLGITSDNDSQMMTSPDEKNLYFARGGVLYRYDMNAGKIIPVYESFSEQASYRYRAYNEQGIRLLKMDGEGTLYFCVYGYFARGSYEGDVAVVLYEYSAAGNLQEMVYMPISSTYQQLKEDFDDYGYVSPRGIYYFTVANTVYAYNMSGKRLEKLAENIKANSFMTMRGANCYVWSSSLSSGYGESITIFDLEKDERKVIYRPDKKSYIRLLGVIENNVVYGFVKIKDIVQNSDGSRVIPCYELYIANTEGEVLKKFSKRGRYVNGIVANGNVINISLCKKQGKTYVDAGGDSILNQSASKTSRFGYTSRVTNKSLTEWYIYFPTSFEMKKTPEFADGPAAYMSSGRTVRLEQPRVAKYYVYALGEITTSFENIGKAIREADKQMGVVVSSDHQVVWERSGSFLQNSIGGLELARSGNGVSNLAACAYMVLAQNHAGVKLSDLAGEDKPVYNMLAEYMERPVNLRGCSLDQVLYFVSGNKSVIAMLSNKKAVVIAGYTTRELYLLDPDSSGQLTVSRTEYEKKFEQAGNRFISYMEG